MTKPSNQSLYQCLPDGQLDASGMSDQSEQCLSRGKLRYLVTERGKDPLGTVLSLEEDLANLAKTKQNHLKRGTPP